MEPFGTEHIRELFQKARKDARKKCLDDVRSNMGINRHWIMFEYRTWFIDSLLKYLDESNYSNTPCWSFEELEKALIDAGIPDSVIDSDPPSYLIVDVFYDTIQFCYDSCGRSILYHGFEYEVNGWGPDTVKLVKLIYDNTLDTDLRPYADACLVECMQEEIRQNIIEATGRGIIQDKFKDTDLQITDAVAQKDIFSCTINTSWSKLDISANLQELQDQIDEILMEKNKYDQMMSVLESDFD
mgnify:FL=1|jgi:hypothetical protein